jgi:FkbM family methyltransferase
MLNTETDKSTILRYAPHAEVVYDCGSRDALDGLEIAMRTNASELHIFECNPPAVELCRQNVRKHAPASLKVTINDMALDERSGTISFYPIDPQKTITPHADGNIGASSLLRAAKDYPNETYVQNEITVKSISLDDYCATHRAPDVLWLDLQGAELRALRGGAKTLDCIDVIHTEVGFRSMYEGQALFWDIDGHLRDKFSLCHVDLGRWPRAALPLLRLLKKGPWVSNAIYRRRTN